jgi:hypothetical protein
MTDVMAEKLSFEEFNQHIDSSHDDGCGVCFSFGDFKHLDQGVRKVAYLGMFGEEQEFIPALLSEFANRQDNPIDDNIYHLIAQTERVRLEGIKIDEPTLIDLMYYVGNRATEMIGMHMPTAWVAVRAYSWLPDVDYVGVIGFMEISGDMVVWDIVMNNVPWDIVTKEKQIVGTNRKSLSLLYMRNKVHECTLHAMTLPSNDAYLTTISGIKAMAALQDPRVLEVMDKLTRHTILDNRIKETCDGLVAYFTKINDTEFVPILEQLKGKCQDPFPKKSATP